MRLYVVVVFTLLFSVGCSNTDKTKDVVAELNKTNIQKVSNAFGLYGTMNNYQSPKNKEELVNYITTSQNIDRNLDMMGIDPATFEDTFISEVDGEEFVIRYKSRVSAMGGGAPIAFEKTGVDGIRRIGFSNGKIVEADDENYERLMKGKVSKEESGPTADETAAGGDADLE